MISPEKKKEIDALTVEQLLYDHRFAAFGDPKFMGDEGDYRVNRLAELRNQDNNAYVTASKNIGWRPKAP